MTSTQEKKDIYCIVPARSGSKRLSNKNITDFCGKPLIAWTIEAALGSEFLNVINVSTDCQHIANIARSFGASISQLRPSHLATDTSNLFDVIRFHLNELEKLPDYILLLQPTSPLRQTRDIDAVITLLKNYDAVISVTKNPKPSSWSKVLNSDLNLAPFHKSASIKKQSQQLKQEYFINGAIYIVSTSRFLEEETFFLSSKVVGYEMPFNRSVDIDTKLDLVIASALHLDLDESLNILMKGHEQGKSSV